MTKLSMVLAIAAGGLAPSVLAETVGFDDTERGDLPPHWTGTQTGTGAAKWTVEREDSAPSKPYVLRQSGEAQYPICIKADTRLQDGYVEVKFKPLSGKKDQAGGVIWRVKDKENYYVCRANALEDNVVLYKTVAGERSALEIVGRKGGYGMEEKVASAQWHTLRVEFHDNHFKVTFDGKHLFDVEDRTFTEAGNVGVWTKADSVMLFDEFSYGTDK
jgi:hypothetical protein